MKKINNLLTIELPQKVYVYSTVEDGITKDFGLTFDEETAFKMGNEYCLASIDDLEFEYSEGGKVFNECLVQVQEGVYRCIQSEDEEMNTIYEYIPIEEILTDLDDETIKKISEVNEFFKDIGITEKDSISDKLLYWHNFMDDSNVFCGEIEFTTLRELKLANFLCPTDDRYYSFIEKYESSEYFSAYKFREELLKDMNETIDVSELQDYFDKNDYVNLHKRLQEIWLDPFDFSEMEFLKGKIRKGLTFEGMVSFLAKNNDTMFIQMLCLNLDYVNSFSENN